MPNAFYRITINIAADDLAQASERADFLTALLSEDELGGYGVAEITAEYWIERLEEDEEDEEEVPI